MHYLSLVIDGITLGSVYAFIALGFHLIYRTAGVLDFAQGDKAVLGGLIALSLVGWHLPVGATLVLIAVIGLVIGLVYEVVIIRPSRRNGAVPAIIATVGASLILANGEEIIWGANARPFPALTAGGFNIGSVSVDWQSLWVVGLLLVVLGALSWFLIRSRFGRAMVAAAADPVAATTLGINVTVVRSIAFGLSLTLAAVGGMLIAPYTLAGGAVGSSLTLKGFTGAIFGGLDSAPGAVVGSLLLGLLENVVGSLLPNGFQDPLDFTLLLAVLLFIPSGIFGTRQGRLA